VSHGGQPEVECLPLDTMSIDEKPPDKNFPALVESLSKPATKGTFIFWLTPVAHERLCLSSLSFG